MLAALYAAGGPGWMLGFVFLVPWLRTLDDQRTIARSLLSAWAMAVAITAAAFPWFGAAIGRYTGMGTALGMTGLLIAAPLFQPQFLTFALARHLAGRRYGVLLRALAAAAAWVATEAYVPRMLDDTLGYGLYPARLLRQAADLGGAAGLTALLLLTNEAVAAAIARRSEGWRAVARPLACATLVPLLLAAYGIVALRTLPAPAGKPLRMGLVQSNIVDYERLRRERGSAEVVREVLDTHFAMSYDAIEHQHADAVLWSETVYPTTFGHAKSEAGAALDRQILETVKAAGVPFVFGTYDRDAQGEYNAAAFVTPGAGLLGMYRKTRLFPLTEYVPAWLDGPFLRRWLPWTGHWQPGNGARVFPLQLADGREIPVLPLICLDDMDPRLAIAGRRLGAQAILTMSNDSWFTGHAEGARLHQAAAAFRSIETRLPQFRVTTNGYSAVIDATGTVVAGSRMGERTLVIGAQPVPEPPATLVTTWGNWVGEAALALLALLAATAAIDALARLRAAGAARPPAPPLPASVAVLPPAARLVAGVLRAFARGSLLYIGAAFLLGDVRLQTDTLAQIRTFEALFLAPEAAAWCVLQAFSARASIDDGHLVLARGTRRLRLPLREIAAVLPWRLPIPGPGVRIVLQNGRRWPYGLTHADPAGLAAALVPAPTAATMLTTTSRAAAYAKARHAQPIGRLARPVAKFVLFPLTLALPAFRLHQHIAYGSAFGEYYSFGLKAYITTFSLWWAAWVIGVLVCAAALRAAVEAATVAAVLLRPADAVDVRSASERLALAALYLGLPAWLLMRVLVN